LWLARRLVMGVSPILFPKALARLPQRYAQQPVYIIVGTRINAETVDRRFCPAAQALDV
jgi:hypothetical protein